MLRHEFSADEESFLVKMRTNLTWDKKAFDRLISAMKQCCEHYDRTDQMETWLAEGFFAMSTEIKDWTTHPGFPREHAPEYYEQAYKGLYDLAFWFFTGSPMYQDGQGDESL